MCTACYLWRNNTKCIQRVSLYMYKSQSELRNGPSLLVVAININNIASVTAVKLPSWVFGTSFECLLIQHRPVLPLPLPVFTLYCFYLLFYYFYFFYFYFAFLTLLPPVSYISSFVLQLHIFLIVTVMHYLSLCICMHLIMHMMKVEKSKCCVDILLNI